MANIKHTYSHFVVLNDGETYTDMTGCRIVDVSGYAVTDYNLCCGYLGEQPHVDVRSFRLREEGDAEKQ